MERRDLPLTRDRSRCPLDISVTFQKAVRVHEPIHLVPTLLTWAWGLLCVGPAPFLLSPGRALTVFQILSSAHSPSPDFLHQNALASVGVQAFGEHISRTLGDAMRKLTSLPPITLGVRSCCAGPARRPPAQHADLRKGRPQLPPGGPAHSLDGSLAWT